jgi:membrane protein DedA with SNARE-associated domain
MAAGALAGSGGLSLAVVLASAVAAALSADLVWYGLGRWRGPAALVTCMRLLRLPPASVSWIECAFRTHQLGIVWSARFLPELNPVAAGLAGVTGVKLSRFLPHAAGSALVWAGAWAGGGFLLAGTLVESPDGVGISAPVLVAVFLTALAVSVLPLVGWLRRGRPAEGAVARTGSPMLLGRLRSDRAGDKAARDARAADRWTAAEPDHLSEPGIAA